MTYHYMVTILGIQGYNKRVIFHRNDLSSLKTLFPSPPSWLPRGDKRREREFFGPREPHGFDRVAKLCTTTIDRIILINIRQLLLASVDADIEANRRRISICDLCN